MPVTTAVILGGGVGSRFGVLTSRDAPRALLPCANAPLLSFPVDWVAASGLQEALIVAAGDATAAAISRWVADEYKGPLKLTVVATPEDKGSAGALHAISHRIAGGQVAVVSGDLICDVPLAALLARHRTSAAAATVLLAPRRASLAPEVKLGRPPVDVDYIGLDASSSQLCFCAASADVREVLRLPRATLRAAGDVRLHTDLLDAGAYVLHASVLRVLAAKPAFTSLKRDLMPYLVRRQFDTRPYASAPALKDDAPDGDAEADAPTTPGAAPPQQSSLQGPLVLAAAPGVGAGGPGPAPGILRKVGAFLAEPGSYVVRCDSLRAYLEINRELASPTDAAHLTGLSLSKHDNYLGKEVDIGAKSAVGAACVVGWGSKLGDKCTMKRSVMGRRCRTGSGVKVVNSVVHDDVVIEDGVQLQNCVVGKGVLLGAGASLRECQVAPGMTVPAGAEHRSEALVAKGRV